MSRPEDTRIREFRESDLPLVQQVIHQTIDVCYSGVYAPRAVEFFKEFHSKTKIIERHWEGKILVVERDGNVIATGAIVRNEILGVFVHPEFQHRGYGRSLMRELENRARSTGCREAVLSVSLPSRGFYQGLGYDLLEECSIDVGEGEHLDFWKARKPLTEETP